MFPSHDQVGVAFPDTFTTSNVTFKASDNGEDTGDFRALSDAGDSSTASAANKIFSAAQDTYVVVNSAAFDGINWIKLASETSQGSARTCTLVLRREPERV